MNKIFKATDAWETEDKVLTLNFFTDSTEKMAFELSEIKPIATGSYDDEEEEKMAYPFIISKEVVDRHLDLVEIETLKLSNYEKNTVVLLNHERNSIPIGKTYKLESYSDLGGTKSLVAWVELNHHHSLYKQTLGSIRDGFLSGASVGIKLTEQPKFDKTTNAYIVKNAELLEWSIVTIPANQETLSIKSMNLSDFEVFTRDLLKMEEQYIDKKFEELKEFIKTINFYDTSNKYTNTEVKEQIENSSIENVELDKIYYNEEYNEVEELLKYFKKNKRN